MIVKKERKHDRMVVSSQLFPEMTTITEHVPRSMNLVQIQVSRLRGGSWATHAALHVIQLWQDVQSEAVSLPPSTISSVHEVAKSQHEAQDPKDTGAVLEGLVPEEKRRRREREPELAWASHRDGG